MKNIVRFASTVALVSSSFMSFSAFAALTESRVAYMREDDHGKQIYIRENDGEVRQITSGQNWHLYPSLSADGRQIASVSGPDENRLRIVVQSLDRQEIEEWTTEGAYLHPDFSGDGRFLAFSGPFGPGHRSQIGIVNIANARGLPPVGSRIENGWKRKIYAVPPRVIASEGKAYFPALSSDGRFLVFQRSKEDGSRDVVEMNLLTNELVTITEANGKSMSPNLSHDDRFIAYTSFRKGNWDIYLWDRHKKMEIRITRDPGLDFAPDFTPEGHLIFASNRGGRFTLYRIAVKDGHPTQAEDVFIQDPQADLYAPSSSGDLRFRQTTLADFPHPARSSFGAAEINGKVYIVGGHQGREHTYPPESFLSRTDIYDIETGAWSQGASRNNAAHGFDVVAHGEYLYAFGGFAYSANHSPQWRSLDVIERYDIANDRWDVIGRMPRKRSSHVVVDVGSKAYLIGGWDSTPKHAGDTEGRFHREIDVFDFATETMTASTLRIPDPLRRAFTAVVHDQKILLLGGISEGSSHFNLLDHVTQLNPRTGQWSELPRLPFATFAPAAGVIGDRVFVFGGMFNTSDMNYEYVNHIFSYAIGANGWRHSGRYLTESKGFSMVVELSPDTLGVLGGHSYRDETDAPVSTFETFAEGL